MGKDSDDVNCTGRRDFLKSLFGLTAAVEPVLAAAARPVNADFYWADLKTGQVGFPTGTAIAVGQPGSIMKLITSATIVEERLLPENQSFDCSGSITIGNAKYICRHAHGRLSLVEALGQSCNVFFAQAARAVNPALLLSYAERFGCHQAVAGCSQGRFPANPTDSPQSYALGLDKDLELNAMQILQLVGLIGTRGTLPNLHSAEQPGDSTTFKITLSHRTWELLQQGMQLACRAGTAHALDPENRLHIAAKTGTSTHGKSFQSWIAGYFPYESPRHAFCLRARSGTSTDQAVPLARTHLFASEWP